MKRLAVIATVTCLLFTGQTEAAKIKGHPQYRAWAKQSLMPMPHFKVFARNRECPFRFEELTGGKAFACARRKTIWVPLGFPMSRWVFFHEIGHVVHRQIVSWWTGDAERFAEAFAWCSTMRNGPFRPGVEYPGLGGWTNAGIALEGCARMGLWVLKARPGKRACRFCGRRM